MPHETDVQYTPKENLAFAAGLEYWEGIANGTIEPCDTEDFMLQVAIREGISLLDAQVGIQEAFPYVALLAKVRKLDHHQIVSTLDT